MKDTAAIIVAGGKGLRYGGRIRKQYLRLKGRPLLWWSAAAFEKCPSVVLVVLVVPRGDVGQIGRLVRAWKFKKIFVVVPGGKSRADSVREGLSAVPQACRYVAVHDAVRPLARPALIESVIAAARRCGAALAACPSRDTVKLAGKGHTVIGSPPRQRVWLAQTPQVFRRSLLDRAHASRPSSRRAGIRRNDVITDDAMLVERFGVRVKLVESSPDNLKVTVPMDLALARLILEGR